MDDKAYERAPGHVSQVVEGTPPPDPVTEQIRADLLSRQRIGWKKYGVGLNRPDFSHREWMKHFYEECLDAAQYAMRVMMTLDGTLISTDHLRDVDVKTETAAEEIARLTHEIVNRQSRILQLACGDPRVRITVPHAIDRS